MRRKYRLLPGSELLRVAYWQRAKATELKTLIKRFATRENHASTKGKPGFVWRSRRLKAVAIYEARFEPVPEIFRKQKLPGLSSYYVHEGKYLWPARGKPGRRVGR